MKNSLPPLFLTTMANTFNRVAFVSFLLLSFASSIAMADESIETVRKLTDAGKILPSEKIISAAKKIKPGDFLEIELEREKKYYVYEVEILDDEGQVWELKFNAKSGKLIELERDD